MDPFTHAAVGIGIAALSGQPASPNNPIYCAAVMGAMAPDIDVISLLKSKMALIKYHRGPTHSLVGLLFVSTIVAGLIYVDFGGAAWTYFLWALAGGLTHVFLDYLNSYGVQVLWPFSNRRWSGNLLMLFDPLMTLFFVPVIWYFYAPQGKAVMAFMLMAAYLLLCWQIRRQARLFLAKEYNLHPAGYNIAVIPAKKTIISWDFFIEGSREMLVGTLNLFNGKINPSRSLDRKAVNPFVRKALHTNLGKFFKQFTSYYHVSYWHEKGKHFVKLIDLRFKHESDFAYKVLFVLDEHMHVEEAYFYRQDEAILVDVA